MKITIDTTNKVIKVEERVSLKELCDEVMKLLPGTWKEYCIDAGDVVYYPQYPTYPLMPGFTTTYLTEITT